MKNVNTGNLNTLEPPFERLAPLPISFNLTRCIVHGNEIIICGGRLRKQCYSYHILKNQYKYICSYPNEALLRGHCVVKIPNENMNEITLLSFGGQNENNEKYTLIMKYVSVWNENGHNKKEYNNKWIDFTDNQNKRISIGKDEDNCEGINAIVSGSNNNLLFITYSPNKIDVFNLDTLQYIKHDILPIENESIGYHCFISKKEKKNEMILFCKKIGLLIRYDENNNNFQFENIRVYTTIRPFLSYGYVNVNDFILFFGGDSAEGDFSKEIYKYSINENKWMKFEQTLPIALSDCNGVITGDNTFIHIIGGYDGEYILSTHIKTNVKKWLKQENTLKEKQWAMEEREKKEIEGMRASDTKIFKRRKEIETIIDHWIHSLSIKTGWIYDFDIIISQYILVRKYFKVSKILQGHSGNVNGVKFSLDGTKVASSSKDETIRIWDVKSGKTIKILKGHSDWVNDVEFSRNGKIIISCSMDKTIRIWDIESETSINILNGHSSNVTRCKFSRDEKNIASCSFDRTIRIWNVKDGNEIKK
ncbi:WD-40 repeat protein [Reticulomyxa filosa]|uniref:WD-40 repeat protein n=1 Tax=Reticulomyxa filosa TaxID=46433 RepID=X6NXU5_RETFI|nr:WD-40 repeat protein [Reticulomyxa filosa]|eukprot:ETO30649.1 WD-40 repeat protein [Reticulomyxa filosa]